MIDWLGKMADVEEDDHGVGQGGTEPSPEQTAAIHAAMMVCYIISSSLQPDNSLRLSFASTVDCTFAEI